MSEFKVGDRVYYRRGGELGSVSSLSQNKSLVFVVYDGDTGSKATKKTDLESVLGKPWCPVCACPQFIEGVSPEVWPSYRCLNNDCAQQWSPECDSDPWAGHGEPREDYPHERFPWEKT